ncbi:MAG: hypothetical protein LBB74_06285 [Chitinispirillales bacterium]|jgi:hypothetical protein|nr:hypothetical protein [Chitinispirillales bacterium]
MVNSGGYGGLLRDGTRAFLAALPFVTLMLFPRAASASGVVSPQVFTRGSIVYVVDQKQITYFSMDTRSAHTLYSSVDSLFDLVGAVRSGDMIWVSNGMGAVVAVNMQTGTLEDFSCGFVGGGGYIDVDRRFVWLAAGDTLHRMDLTSREWVKIAVPSKSALTIRGLLSFNEQVHIITSGAAHILTVASGDWVTVPHGDFSLAAGDVRRIGDAVYFTQDRAVYRYDPSKRLFAGAAVKERIRAVGLGPNDVDVVAGSRVYTFNARSFSLEPGPAIPILRNVISITRDSITNEIVCATDMGLVTYTSPFNLWAAPYPDHVTVDGGVFVFRYNGHTVLYRRGGFVIYSPDRKLWSGVRIKNRSDVVRKGQYGWDEDGAHITFSDKYTGTPSGTATFRGRGNVEYADTGDLVINPPVPLPNATLNLHTEDPDGRVLDLTVDNAVTTQPPQKGFYYKGIEGDILSRASFGVQGTGLARSNVSPTGTVTEGASVVFSGPAANRERGIVTATAGSGYLLSKTEWRIRSYASDGLYYLDDVGENMEVVANTVKMYVDGIPLQATDYTYNPANRAVRLLRREKINPTSIIQVSFAERRYPMEREVFEPLPEDHVGQYNFVEGVVSPREWMYARAGFLTVDRGEEGGGLSPVTLAGIPMEWRGAGGRSLLFYPEIAYDNKLGAHSAGVTAGVTEGRAFGSYSGRWVGRDFIGLDKLMFNYRGPKEDMNDEHEVNIGYDLSDNFRASLYQVHRRTEYNSLSNFELRTQYTGENAIPDVEMAASGLFSENDPGTETSMRSRKETFSLRLSDLSVRYLREVKGIHNLGYDISWSEYISNASERGRVAYGMVNLSPISSLTFTGTTMYRFNPSGFRARSEVNPQISVNTRDLPRGVDMSASYSVYILNIAAGGKEMSVSGNVRGYFYPGEYVEALNRIALYGLCLQETETSLPEGTQPMRYVIFPNEELITYQRTRHEVGLLFFPTDNLLLSTLNTRSGDVNSGEINYGTYERAGLWLRNGSKLEAGAGVDASKLRERWRFYADALYEHRWGSGFMTGVGAFGSHLTDKDTLDIEAGPILTASVTKELSGYIRSIENSHNLRVAVVRGENVPVPDFAYAFYFRLKMLPDISIEAELGANIHGQKTAIVWAGAYLHAGF